MLDCIDIKRLFPGTLSAKPYSVNLYRSYVESIDVLVDESRNICMRGDEETRVNNCHGTDVDYTYSFSKYTLEQMANFIERNYGSDAYAKDRLCVNENAFGYVDGLRQAANTFEGVFCAGKDFFMSQLPDFKCTTLKYSSAATAVFEVETKEDKKYIVKMTCISKKHRGEVDVSHDKIMHLEGDTNLMPVLRKQWFELDEDHEMLVIWMPMLGEVGFCHGGSVTYQSYKKGGDEYGTYFEQLLNLGKDVARALSVLHENGLVHHDVKPENLFFNKTSNSISWYLGDFSSVKSLREQYKGRTSVTLAYAAPEIIEKKPYTYSSDVYSWGRTLFFLYKKTIPRNANPIEVTVKRDNIDMSYYGGGSSHWYEKNPRAVYFYRVLSKALHPDPAMRYANGKELLHALEKIDDGSYVDEEAWPELPEYIETPMSPEEKAKMLEEEKAKKDAVAKEEKQQIIPEEQKNRKKLGFWKRVFGKK